MASKLTHLFRQRDSYNLRLNSFSNYLQEIQKKITVQHKLTSRDSLEVKQRMQKIELVASEFDKIQEEIEILVKSRDLDEQYAERTAFDKSYYALHAEAEEILNTHDIKNENAYIVAQPTHSLESNNNVNSQQVNLPVINLPQFSGAYEEWTPFFDTFKSLIHTNDTLPNIKKFYYLRSSLQGEALQVIQGLELSAINYEAAWSLLQKRYHNKKLMIHNHIKAITEFEKMTKESYSSLRKLLDTIQTHTRALKCLGEPVDSWDSLLIYVITEKFDNNTAKEWEMKVIKSENMPKISALIEFLETRCNLLERVNKQSNTCSQAASTGFKKMSNNKHAVHFSSESNKPTNCKCCNSHHPLFYCQEFLKKNIEDRTNFVKNNKLCFNCLREGHGVAKCKARHCTKCNKAHNTVLHREEETKQETSQEIETIKTSTANSTKSQSQILLATAVVKIKDKNGKWQFGRALLDSGSQSNFMTTSFSERLKYTPRKSRVSVNGINNAETEISQSLNLTLFAKNEQYNKTLQFLIMPTITSWLPTTKVERANLNLPQVQLADEEFDEPREIDMLIGAEIYFEILEQERINLGRNLPILYKTTLGWILSGPVSNKESMMQTQSYHTVTKMSLEDTVECFWKIEELPTKQHLSTEEILCEELFDKTHTRSEHGNFVIKLPFKQDEPELGDSYTGAHKRFLQLERRFKLNPSLKSQYDAFMQEYQELGHMEIDSNDNTSEGYYLPHHAVFKSSSLSTKIRVVFDGSAKTSNGNSLNDQLMVGPTIQENLFSILINFRMHNIVMTADIEKMYRQIQVDENDCKYQKILWRTNEQEPIQTFKLKTVTYGTACAPYLAIRSLQQIAVEAREKHPKASEVITKSFYVDDLLTGVKSLDEANKLKQELTDLLKNYGFHLRKWLSNNSSLTFGDENDNDHLISLDSSKTTKTLGIMWNAQNDTIHFVVPNFADNIGITKRQILSQIAQLFDPLGLISPVIVKAKIIMQDIWDLKIDWDQIVPEHITTEWQTFCQTMSELNCIKISRHILSVNYKRIQIHGYADASEKAYGAALYIRSTDTQGNHLSRLMCSKSRVAPLKKLSLPRLELCAAQLLARLYDAVSKSLSLNINETYLWSDSTITLFWINTEPNKLKTFVANRVAEIRATTEISQWKHVNSIENPSDILSRGRMPHQLKEESLWWEGPRWLRKDEEEWPETKILFSLSNHELLDMKTTSVCNLVIEQWDIFDRYSSLVKLQRIMAYCIRFIENLKNKEDRRTGPLTSNEIQISLEILIRVVQKENFSEDIESLKELKQVSSNSKLKSLSPFIDKKDIMRVGGRLRHANITYSQRFPMLLPKNHKLTNLVIRHEHLKLLHAGPQAVLASIRLKFWPISAKGLIRKIIHNCVICTRAKPKDLNQIMGDLPEARITQSRPFLRCGVDFCGPFHIKDFRGRGKTTRKAYVAVFICLAVKAVHLEVVSNLSSEAFIAALRRFVARRGKCSDIYCDNGTNFIGAKTELDEIRNFLNNKDTQDQIQDKFSQERIQFHFIPPRSPHFGGLWEAAVKSAKHHLKRCCMNANLTFEELLTLLAQVEACLNSRPITEISPDPNDPIPLTPGHFLIGDSFHNLPDTDLTHIQENRLSHWQRIQAITQHFWKRWSDEYLTSLQVRTKWHNKREGPKVGDIVILKEPTPPTTWHLGKIEELHPGKDGQVRVVSVKTASGLYKRAITKICLLPVTSVSE